MQHRYWHSSWGVSKRGRKAPSRAQDGHTEAANGYRRPIFPQITASLQVEGRWREVWRSVNRSRVGTYLIINPFTPSLNILILAPKYTSLERQKAAIAHAGTCQPQRAHVVLSVITVYFLDTETPEAAEQQGTMKNTVIQGWGEPLSVCLHMMCCKG